MKRLVLVGAGHAHARVLLEFARHPMTEVDVVLINPAALAPYSGMVPGWMAGHYQWDECCIDFARLCRVAGATLRLAVVGTIDPAARVLWLDDGAQLHFDLLSLDIGSTTTPPSSEVLPVMPMRPLGALKRRWEELRTTVTGLPPGARFRVVVVGGGAAGVETVLAARRQLMRWAPHVQFDWVLANNGGRLLPALAAAAGSMIERHLEAQGIDTVSSFAATRFDGSTVISRNGRHLDADFVMWAGGAQAHRLASETGLECDADGFVRVDAHLRSLSHPAVFAAGDCASLLPALPKAGVFAVRMGPILAHNLRAALNDGPMKPYQAQRRNLVLLGTGGDHAVAAWGPFAWQGNWVWRWKRRIDQGFLQQYNDAPTNDSSNRRNKHA